MVKGKMGNKGMDGHPRVVGISRLGVTKAVMWVFIYPHTGFGVQRDFSTDWATD